MSSTAGSCRRPRPPGARRRRGGRRDRPRNGGRAPPRSRRRSCSSKSREFGDRGRHAHCRAPPAQIRTGPIRASGSHLGCLTAKRRLGQGMHAPPQRRRRRRGVPAGKRPIFHAPTRDRAARSTPRSLVLDPGSASPLLAPGGRADRKAMSSASAGACALTRAGDIGDARGIDPSRGFRSSAPMRRSSFRFGPPGGP
jgi:hypothetical protein